MTDDATYQGVFFEKNQHLTFTFKFNDETREMLRITPEGFYIQGKLVEDSVKDSLSVYETFKKWLAYGVISG